MFHKRSPAASCTLPACGSNPAGGLSEFCDFNAADSVGLMRESGYLPDLPLFLLYTANGHLRRDALSLKIVSTAQDAVISLLLYYLNNSDLKSVG